MSFRELVYPHRENRLAFVTAVKFVLMGNSFCWKRIEHLSDRQKKYRARAVREPGQSFEDYIKGRYLPKAADRRRVLAILSAWGEKDDRYVDFQALRSIHITPGWTMPALEQRVAENAVKHIRKELEALDHFFGKALPEHTTFDSYFTGLLAWDFDHCFGVVRAIVSATIRQEHDQDGPLWIGDFKIRDAFSNLNMVFARELDPQCLKASGELLLLPAKRWIQNHSDLPVYRVYGLGKAGEKK